jgi:hypothetical protein
MYILSMAVAEGFRKRCGRHGEPVEPSDCLPILPLRMRDDVRGSSALCLTNHARERIICDFMDIEKEISGLRENCDIADICLQNIVCFRVIGISVMVISNLGVLMQAGPEIRSWGSFMGIAIFSSSFVTMLVTRKKLIEILQLDQELQKTQHSYEARGVICEFPQVRYYIGNIESEQLHARQAKQP